LKLPSFDLAEGLTHIQSRAAAIPRHNRCHAHAQEIFSVRLSGYFIRMRVNVNKAGRDDQSLGVYLGFGLTHQSPDLRDAPALDAQVGEVGRLPVPSAMRPLRIFRKFPRGRASKSRRRGVRIISWRAFITADQQIIKVISAPQ
jgi:hypothetical protein